MKRSLPQPASVHESRLHAIAAKAWRRVALRKVGNNDNHQGLDRLYALPDPWSMTSEREQVRFQKTNEIIRTQIGSVDRMLEIGCGEGHQSEHLRRLCNRLDGLDVSVRAVSRAAARVPDARFGVGEVVALPWALSDAQRYDLVVACEVLYYLGDVTKTIDEMSRLGRACLVTFFSPAARRVAPYVDGIPGLQKGWIFSDPYAWLWALWRPACPPTESVGRVSATDPRLPVAQ